MRGLVAAAVAVATLLPGCLEPHFVRVDAEAVARSGWRETLGERSSASVLGPNFAEARYSFRGSANGPYPGELVVVSVRAALPLGSEALLERAQQVIEDRAAEYRVELSDTVLRGSRQTVQGLTTHYVIREGSTRQAGTLFGEDVSVRILAEVGEDGSTRTAFVAVGYVQVSRQPDCTILELTCQGQPDLRSWVRLAGDPEGSVEGAKDAFGLVYNVVTHP